MKSFLSIVLFSSMIPPNLMAIGQQPGTTQPVLGANPPLGAPAAPPPAPDAPSANPVSPSYVIGPQDVIQVTVWKEPALSQSLTVRPDGMISLPLLGDISASGLTPTLLSTDLSSRLKKYINDPLVTVTVVTVNSKRVFLLGEVGHVGGMALTPDMTPLQAIAAAGGLSPYANAKHIYILRTDNGKQKKIFFDYKKAIKTGNEQGIVLVPGDTIVVP